MLSQSTVSCTLYFVTFSVLLEFVGAITWCLNLPEKHYVFWSMGVTLVAASIYMLCAVLMIPDIRAFDYQYIRMRKQAKKQKKGKRGRKTKLDVY